MTHDVIIVIPIYRPFTANEERSFLQCIKILGKYDITFIKPFNLDISSILQKFPSVKCVSIENKWFNSIHSYNRMVLSTFFYKLFKAYKYILIYQLDAYVFKDELTEWVAKDYDYVGSPWLPGSNKYEGWLGRLFLNARLSINKLLHSGMSSVNLHYKVGNGGLSLRKVSKMIEITEKYKKQIEQLLLHKGKFFQEDVFLCIQIGDDASLSMPEYKEALGFGFELNPQLAYKLNGNKLPFGCHDWERKKRWDRFWKYYIQ